MWQHKTHCICIIALTMYCSDLLDAYVAISGMCFAVGFRRLIRRSTARSNLSLVSLDTEESINFEACADPGFTSWNSNVLPSNNSCNCVATITQCYTRFLY